MSSGPPGLSGALTPWGPVPAGSPYTEVAERILDAAHRRFVVGGIGSTTMSQLAADVGISRVWLYRHFPNRDAVVTAVVAREVQRFLEGLRIRFVIPGDPQVLVRDGFVYAVEFLRGHELFQRILVTEPDAVAPFLLDQAGSVMQLAIGPVSRFLERRAGLDRPQARTVAETLARLALSVALTGRAAVDFDDPRQLRAFAADLVPRLLHDAGR